MTKRVIAGNLIAWVLIQILAHLLYKTKVGKLAYHRVACEFVDELERRRGAD